MSGSPSKPATFQLCRLIYKIFEIYIALAEFKKISYKLNI